MSDWQVGDLAVCVNAGEVPGNYPRPELRKGVTYKVVGVGPDGSFLAHPCLFLAEVRSPAPGGGFHQDRFRKILPDQHEPCEQEFVTLIKRSKVPAQAIEAQRATTENTGVVHESAVAKPCAQEHRHD